MSEKKIEVVEKLEKFKEKNIDSYNELDEFLDKKFSDIRYIVTSNELALLLTNELPIGGSWLWNNKVMIPNPYQAANKLDLILNNDTVYSIRFSVPCVCNIYKDEEHP